MHEFVDLTEAVPGVWAEVRYATSHNLTGHPLAGYTAPRALATHEAVLEDTLLLLVDGSGKVVFVRKERL